MIKESSKNYSCIMTVFQFGSRMCRMKFMKLRHVYLVYIAPVNPRHSLFHQATMHNFTPNFGHCTMRTALFWIITQRAVAIPYGRFGTTYRSQLHGSTIQYTMYVHGKTETQERLRPWPI